MQRMCRRTSVGVGVGMGEGRRWRVCEGVMVREGLVYVWERWVMREVREGLDDGVGWGGVWVLLGIESGSA